MIEVMKDEGGNVYKITHMGKDKLKKRRRAAFGFKL
jgi:hypothetical protein